MNIDSSSVLFSSIIFLLIVIISLLLKYNYFLKHKQQRLEKKLSEESTQLFNQFESYHFIRDRLELNKGLPYTRDWSASPDFLKLIAEHCLKQKPKIIVECSSGLSSLVLAKCCQLNQQGKLFSLENGEVFADESRAHLKRYKLDHIGHIIHAPLKNFCLNKIDYQWYDISQLADESIDMLVIDGPPGFIQNNSRYPALPLLFKKLSKDCVIFMDDAARPDEKNIVNMWLQEFTGLEHEYISLNRGCSVLRFTCKADKKNVL